MKRFKGMSLTRTAIAVIFFIFLLTTLIVYSPAKVEAAPVDITITIPDGKLARVKAGILASYPNNECSTLNIDGTTCDVYKYNDNEWLKEVLRRFIVSSVRKGERILGRVAAEAAIVQDHNSLAE